MKKRFSMLVLATLIAGGSVTAMAASPLKEWRNLNADPFIGQLKHRPENREEAISQIKLAVKLLGFPAEVQVKLIARVKCGGRRYFIRQGDFIPAMLAGTNKILRDRTVNWQNYNAPLPATWYQVNWKGKTYVLVVPWVCYNWTRGDVNGVVKMRRPRIKRKIVEKTVAGSSDLSYVQYEGEAETAIHKRLPSDIDSSQYDAIIEAARKASAAHMDEWWEHNVDAGIYAAQSELARWVGAWVDTISWLKTVDPEVGIGVFASLNIGEVRISDYDWTEIMIAIQLGAQKTWADWETNNIRQIQVKLRPGFFWQEGGSNVYGRHQMEVGLGGRTEYTYQFSPKITGYLVAEGFLDIANVHFSSTAEQWGDGPERRSWLNVGFEFNHYLNEHWDFRWGLGINYSWWDELTGLTGFAKFRYNSDGYYGIWNFGVNGMYPLALGLLNGVYSASQIAYGGIFLSWEGREYFLEGPDQRERVTNINQVPNPYKNKKRTW